MSAVIVTEAVAILEIELPFGLEIRSEVLALNLRLFLATLFRMPSNFILGRCAVLHPALYLELTSQLLIKIVRIKMIYGGCRVVGEMC
jgi:hypothetical protein